MSRKIRVHFISPPFSGHLNPLIELAQYLNKANKYEICFITGESKIPLLESLSFQAIPISLESNNSMENIANTTFPVRNNPLSLYNQLKANLKLAPFIKKEIYRIFNSNWPDIAVIDSIAVPASIVCKELDIPWITTVATPFCIENHYGTPSYMGGWKNSKKLLYKIRDFYGVKTVRLFKLIMASLLSKEFESINFKIYRPDGTESVYSNYSTLGLGMEEFEFPRDWPQSFKFIGPCCSSPDKDISLDIPFNQFEKSILVSLGTHLEWAKQDLIEKVTYLAKHLPQILFVVSLGRQSSQTKPTQKQSNVIAFDYIPYSQYLQKFDAVIHHGGAGITYNCIKYCKPALVIPHDYDQFDFAARIEFQGVGIKVKKLASQQTVSAIPKLFTEDLKNHLNKINKLFLQYAPGEKLEREIHKLLN